MLAAINALRASQRELFERMGGVKGRLTAIERSGADTNARVRSLEESNAEIKDLIVRALTDR